MHFYLFDQNNSGGVYYEDDLRGIAEFVIIESSNKTAAIKKARSIGLFRLPYCECCGTRFDLYPELIEDQDSVIDFNTIYSVISIGIHLSDGRTLFIKWKQEEFPNKNSICSINDILRKLGLMKK